VLAVVLVLDGRGARRPRVASGVDRTTTSVPPTSTAAPATTSAPAPSTTTPPGTLTPIPVDRTYLVETDTRTFVDTTRATSANGDAPGAPDRTLVTSFWFPDAPGTFPLVVFAHGYAVTPEFYAPMLERWAAAGYVVAAPEYPILSGSAGGASHVDYEKTFVDTSFVITETVALGDDDPLGARVATDRIAVTGHSDGEVIAFGIGFLECCRDPRVRSVIAMAGNLENANNPHVRDTGTPILHVMETGDEYDPYGASIAWDRENLTAPRWMLTLEGATHVPPYQTAGDPHFELLVGVVVDFLDGTLKGHPERLERIDTAVAAASAAASLER
jgi:dienelactone hydrolase